MILIIIAAVIVIAIVVSLFGEDAEPLTGFAEFVTAVAAIAMAVTLITWALEDRYQAGKHESASHVDTIVVDTTAHPLQQYCGNIEKGRRQDGER